MGNPYISKSKFVAGRQCLKREWLQIHDFKLGERTAVDAKEQGDIVGNFARQAFSGGVLVETPNCEFDQILPSTSPCL
jgi:hypothetical protein